MSAPRQPLQRGRGGSRSRALLLLFALAGLAGATLLPSAGAVVKQLGNLRVAVNGKLTPRALPREGSAPVGVSVSGRVSTSDQSPPPQLRQLSIEINRHGRFETAGLPLCPAAAIRTASNGRALAVCGPALVGQGKFAGTITLPGSAPYPIAGRLLLFNATEKGHPVLLAHIYSPHPFATSFLFAFQIAAKPDGTYGTVLTANLGSALGSERNLTAIEMTLQRRYTSSGQQRSYLSAACPAPKGFPGAVFPLARTSFTFADGRKLTSTLTSNCAVRP